MHPQPKVLLSPSNIYSFYNPNNPPDLLDQPILYSIDFLFKWLTSVLLWYKERISGAYIDNEFPTTSYRYITTLSS